jgi:hypothetical protein
LLKATRSSCAALNSDHGQLSLMIKQVIQSHEEERRQSRQKLIQSFPSPCLERSHLEGAKLLPTRYDLLQELPKGSVVCEIGVANGDFSAQILECCRPRQFHLVDAWEAERYKADQLIVQTRFADAIQSGLVQLHLGLSTDRLPEFPDHLFDWVYLDTVHDYRITAQELAICLQKVKPGGIIAGHDYTPGNLVTPVCYGVIQAVQEFCVKNHWKFLYLTCESNGYASFAIQTM